MEFRGEDLGDFDCEEDGGEAEDYAVGDGWDQDVWISEKAGWSQEILGCEGEGPDFAESEVFAAKG